MDNSEGRKIPEDQAAELADFHKANAGWLFGHACLRTQRDRDLNAAQELAEELVQDAFVAAVRDWQTVRGLTVEQQRAWLIQTVAHKETDAFRRRRKFRDLLPELHRRYQATEKDPEWQALSSVALEKAVKIVYGLPVRQRDIALMKWNDHMTDSEIADEMGCTRGAITAQVHEIRRKLMDGLGPYYLFAKDDGKGDAS